MEDREGMHPTASQSLDRTVARSFMALGRVVDELSDRCGELWACRTYKRMVLVAGRGVLNHWRYNVPCTRS
jgi:hypothetical protein